MPSRIITRLLPPRARLASAINASVPPSPSLSARSRIRTYFTVTMRISAEDERSNAKDPRLGRGVATVRRRQHGFAQSVEGARADVAVDDADTAERQAPKITARRSLGTRTVGGDSSRRRSRLLSNFFRLRASRAMARSTR